METENIEPVRVVARCRPLLSREIQEQRESIVKVNQSQGEISITNPNSSSSEDRKNFSFDHVFGPETSQNTIYNEIAFPIVHSVLRGYNGTIFAYGQTGAGKTYTMQGNVNFKESKGIIPRAIEQIFNSIESTPDKQFVVRVSFLEIYNEEVSDLFNKDQKSPLLVREKPGLGVFVEGLLSIPVENVADAYQKLATGNQNRAVRLTQMGRCSSRSHTIFTITIEYSETGPDGEHHIKMGKLNLVDLAGSERQKKAQVTGMGLRETAQINKSLIALGDVISVLASPKPLHIPYRNSKLTRLLQDSLGGNTKTVLITNIGPADWNFEETMCTLKFASRVKSIINEDLKNAKLKGNQEERGESKVRLNGGGDENKRQNVEEKRKIIEAQENLADDERQRLLADLASREEDQKVADERQVLKGSEVIESTKQQEEIKRLKNQLEEKALREQKLAQKLAEQEAEIRSFRTMHCELEEEKNKKIDKLEHELKRAKTEIQGLQKDFDEERKVYKEQIDHLNSQLKLKEEKRWVTSLPEESFTNAKK